MDADPFADADHTTQCLSEQRNRQEEGPAGVVAATDATNVTAHESLECLPIYENTSLVSTEKSGGTPQQASVPADTAVIYPVADHATPVTIEIEWYETLRELQENITDLRNARGRASRFSALSHVAPTFWRACRTRRVEESAREVRVLEELVLAGMRRLCRLHPDPLVQAVWNSRSEEFSHSLYSSPEGSANLNVTTGIAGHDLEGGCGTRCKRRAARIFAKGEDDTALVGLTKAIGILLVTPVALAGAAVFGAGVMMYGAGKLVVELGHLMTCGKLR